MSETAESLAARFREDIYSGSLPEGAKLPSITEIVDQYDIGRGAAHQALTKLRAEGLIVSRHGAGNFVSPRFARITRPSPGRLSASRWGTGKAIQDLELAGRWNSINIKVDEVPAPDFVAEAFGIAVGDVVVRRSRTYTVDGRPVQLAMSYFPVDLARGTAIVYHDTGPGGVYARLRDGGHGPTNFVERVIGRAPSPEETSELKMRRAQAMVFEITRRALAGDRCVEVNRMVLDVEAYELVYEFPA